MQLQPVWSSAAFWTTVIGAIAAIVAGLNYNAEAEMIGAIAAIVIGYLASRGYVAAQTVKAAGALRASEDEAPQEVKF